MKISFPHLALTLAIFVQPVQADLVSDSEQIMNDAQLVYSEFFPTNQNTQTFTPYLYRFYPSTGVYLGINQEDSGVYLLGGSFGDTPLYVEQVNAVKVLLQSQLGDSGSNNNQKAICNTADIPKGFFYKQEGNTTSITTNGRCLQLPENRSFCDALPEKNNQNQVVSTNIHALSNTTLSSFELTGIAIPGFDSIAQGIANQKTCVIHAPTELINHAVNFDICLDITNQLGDLSLLPGVTAPVTTRIAGLSTSTIVGDCFNTDAASIINLVTKETWINQNGSFVKLN